MKSLIYNPRPTPWKVCSMSLQPIKTSMVSNRLDPTSAARTTRLLTLIFTSMISSSLNFFPTNYQSNLSGPGDIKSAYWQGHVNKVAPFASARIEPLHEKITCIESGRSTHVLRVLDQMWRLVKRLAIKTTHFPYNWCEAAARLRRYPKVNLEHSSKCISAKSAQHVLPWSITALISRCIVILVGERKHASKHFRYQPKSLAPVCDEVTESKSLEKLSLDSTKSTQGKNTPCLWWFCPSFRHVM